MADCVPAYCHEPLDPARDQIRLVKLLPQLHSGGDIQCELQVCDLATAPVYHAISYEWGPPDFLHNLTIDERTLQIRHNLWLFLDMFRKRTENHSLLWIDQITIDQRNPEERNSQVKLMGEIFSGAQLVIVWLGLGDGVRKDLIEALERHTIDPDKGEGFRTRVKSGCHLDPCAACSHTNATSDYNAGPGRRAPDLPRSLDVSELSYWTRLWIVQELVLAKDITVFVSSTQISYTVLSKYLQLLYSLDTIFWGLSDLPSLISLTDPNKQRESLGLDQAVQRFASSALQCSIAHDLVFGLLGMVDSAKRVAIDYHQQTPMLFEQTMEHILFSPTLRASVEADASHASLTRYIDRLALELGTTTHWNVWLDKEENSRELPWLAVRNLFDSLTHLEMQSLNKQRWTLNGLIAIIRATLMMADIDISSNDLQKRVKSAQIKDLALVEKFNRAEGRDLSTILEEATGSPEMRNINNRSVPWNIAVSSTWDPIQFELRKEDPPAKIDNDVCGSVFNEVDRSS